MAIVEKPKSELATSAIEHSVTDIMVTVNSIAVTDDIEYAKVKEFGLALKDLKKQVGDLLDEPCAKAHEAHKSLTAKRKSLLDPIKAGLDIVSKKLGEYEAEQEREAKRQAQALSQMETEARRKEAELYAEQLLDQGHTAEAAAQLRHAENLPEAVVEVETHRPEAAKGGTTRTTWKFDITDESLLPREFLMPDDKAIRAYINAKKDRAQIPGVRIWSEKKHHV